MRHHEVASTLIGRCFDVMCLLGLFLQKVTVKLEKRNYTTGPALNQIAPISILDLRSDNTDCILIPKHE